MYTCSIYGVLPRKYPTTPIDNFKRVTNLPVRPTYHLSLRLLSPYSTYIYLGISRIIPAKEIRQIENFAQNLPRHRVHYAGYNHRAAVVRDTFNFPACVRVIIGSEAEKENHAKREELGFLARVSSQSIGREGALRWYSFFLPSPSNTRVNFVSRREFFRRCVHGAGVRNTRMHVRGSTRERMHETRARAASRLLLARKKRPANSRSVPAASAFPLYKVNYMADAR